MKKVIFTIAIAIASLVSFSGCMDNTEEVFEQVDKAKTENDKDVKGL